MSVIAMTYHKLIIGNCANISEIKNNSIHLVVTSPPYFNVTATDILKSNKVVI